MFMTTNFFIMLAIVVYLFTASVTTVQKISILAAVRWDLS